MSSSFFSAADQFKQEALVALVLFKMPDLALLMHLGSSKPWRPFEKFGRFYYQVLAGEGLFSFSQMLGWMGICLGLFFFLFFFGPD